MRRRAWTIIGIVVLLILIFGGTAVTMYTDWLWFGEVKYLSIFWTRITTKLGLGLVAGILFFILVYINLWLARRLAPPTAQHYDRETTRLRMGRFAQRGLGMLILALTIVVSVFVGLEASSHWLSYQMFTHAVSFSDRDPIFHRDIGFYIFQLGFLRYIYGWLLFTVVVAGLATAAVHYIDRAIEVLAGMPTFAPRVKAHLSLLFAAVLFIKAWGYRLDAYDLMYSGSGVVYGAGYTDVHARLVGYSILIVVALIAGLLALVNIYRRGIQLPALALIILIVASILLGWVYPGFVQQVYVKPNEIKRETPYIHNNIQATRKAFNLDTITTKDFPAENNLTTQDIQNNKATINSIRLWDYRPIQSTYEQLQALGPYYAIRNVDIDRYDIQGQLRQVMLAARELTLESASASASTWVNKHFQYTHGYGAVMSPVNTATPQGLPEFFVQGLPPTSSVGINISRPQIYYGELTGDYVIANSGVDEFDYPAENKPVYTKYSGNGGIGISSYLRRMAFAWRFGAANLMLSNPITKDSRLMFRRNITERVRTILPFLKLDQDPYLVISGGRLYWIMDAYTISRRYPYATPFVLQDEYGYTVDSYNYIRNSAKILIDAYNGTVDCYIADSKDPIISAYSRVFPGVFKPLDRMPADLRAHIRYPEDIFRAQCNMLLTYHMKNPQVFFNKSDLWDIPREMVGTSGTQSDMSPYYVVMTLPGEASEEFLMMFPFTPANRDNMIAWMAAKSGPKDYGKMILYLFPRTRQIPGPAQVESMINQDTTISAQLSLWSRAGSKVNRGNQIVIPIQNSILYIKPLYLESESSKIPELKRVVAAYGDQVVMANTLTDALNSIFGEGAAATSVTPTPGQTAAPTTAPAGAAPSAQVRRLIDQAVAQYERAQKAQRAGDWATYGEQTRQLGQTLNQLRSQTGR